MKRDLGHTPTGARRDSSALLKARRLTEGRGGSPHDAPRSPPLRPAASTVEGRGAQEMLLRRTEIREGRTKHPGVQNKPSRRSRTGCSQVLSALTDATSGIQKQSQRWAGKLRTSDRPA